MEAALQGPTGTTSLGATALKIGRVPDNQLVLTDPKSSSHHAEIRPEGQSYALIDLGSTNGTFVNEQQLAPRTPRTLTSGDTIRIGDTTFTYTVSGEPEVDPTVRADAGPPANPAYQPTVFAPAQSTPSPAASDAAYAEYQPPAAPAYVPPPDANANAVPNYNIPSQPPAYGVPQPPAYGVPQQPGYNPAAYGQQPFTPPQRKRSPLLVIGIIIGALVLVCVVGAFAVAAVNASSPKKTMDAFCNAIQAGDPGKAYDQFGTDLTSQQGLTRSSFIATVDSNGINGCTYTDPTTNNKTATGTTTLSSSKSGGSHSYATTLRQEDDGIWRIESLQ